MWRGWGCGRGGRGCSVLLGGLAPVILGGSVAVKVLRSSWATVEWGLRRGHSIILGGLRGSSIEAWGILLWGSLGWHRGR